MDDDQLLERYAAEVSEEAFAELTRRHTGLVYSAAMRQVRNPQLAQDVTQVVFAHLARQAHSIPKGTVLAGWLHRDTRYTALDFIRADARRYRREQQFTEMNAPHSEPQPGWEEVRPLLDEALTKLPQADRDALLLRFFEQLDFAGVGSALGASAEAARKRVDRALERLREYLVKRGITTTSAALGGTLMAHAVETVPAGFVVSLAAGSAAASSAGSWVSNLMLMTNTKIAFGTALLAVLLAAPLIIQQQALAVARAEQSDLQGRLRDLPGPVPATRQTSGLFDSTTRDRADLERLRREASALGAKIAECTAQAQRLLAASPAHKPGSVPLGKVLRMGELRDAGQNTPEATMETFLWAMLHGDTNRIGQLLSVREVDSLHNQEVLENLLGKFTKESSQMRNDVEAGGMDNFVVQVLEKYPGQNDDQWIVTETVVQKNEAATTRRILLCPTDTGWKWAVGANGEPIEEDANQP
jgi:RNA polymerase sigma factor (sigma-70 family)